MGGVLRRVAELSGWGHQVQVWLSLSLGSDGSLGSDERTR